MKVLILNCGGSSVKCKLFEMPEEKVLAKGAVERIGKDDAAVAYKKGSEEVREIFPIRDHGAALEVLIKYILGSFGNNAVEIVGHRMVHGGREVTGSVLITEKVKETVRTYSELAPLHNPPNLRGIEACEKLLPGLPQVGVFDTALHTDLPVHAYTYALPYELCDKYRIRRYGFHGIAFRYMAERASALFKRSLAEMRLVQLMLGSGTTANALFYGKSIDVSTGLTPTEGLVQSTRCGDLDPLVVTYLMRKENFSPEQMDKILCNQSGWLGISGVSNDLREVEAAAFSGDGQARAALETFIYRTKKYIGAYAAAMGGVDAVTIAGGVGEGSARLRAGFLTGLEFLGLVLDPERNEGLRGEGIISADGSKVSVAVVAADEELVIARDTWALARK
ncbi:MAG: acetate/propionate family kinase [Bacillota bacterium]